MVMVSASQPRGRGFEPYIGYDTSTGRFKEADLRVIYINCENLFQNLAKIRMFKLRNKVH